MKHLRFITPCLLIALLVISCGRDNDDEDAIQALIESSRFVGEGTVQTADDSTNVPAGLSGAQLLQDTIDFVRWVRWIERPVTREFDITVTGDSAEVTVTTYLNGVPPGYGLFVINDPFGPVLQRSIADVAVRHIKLHKDEQNQWRITSLTVADVSTQDTQYPVIITEIRAEVQSRQYVFIVDSPDSFFTKEQLPTFHPSDTVEVTVTCSAVNDSTWAFLHHGVGHRPGHGWHIRQPFYRENTTTFTRTWVIADDSIITTPAVRHSATDVLGWQTLWGDSSATYYSRAWCLPYIVKEQGQSIPDDTE
jgi:hypothetical protein